MTQNGSEPEDVTQEEITKVNGPEVVYTRDAGVLNSLQEANEKALDDHIEARGDKYLSDEPEVTPLIFPDRVRFMIHTGPNSAIEGWADFKSHGLASYMIYSNSRTLADLVRSGHKIKAHMYFEIAPPVEANDGTE